MTTTRRSAALRRTPPGPGLWDAMAHGRPQGAPVYVRPGPRPGPGTELPWTGLEPLDDPPTSSPDRDRSTELACWLTAVSGITRFEPHDLLGPHHVTPTIRGVRVTRTHVHDRAGWRGYDPVRHALVAPGDAPTAAGVAAADAVRLTVHTDQVPAGYDPLREVVGLLEAGMHAATAALAGRRLLPGWTVRPGRPSNGPTPQGWPALTLTADPLPRPRRGRDGGRGSGPATCWDAVLARVAAGPPLTASACRARTSGRGPWGVTPRPPDHGERRATAAVVDAWSSHRPAAGLLQLRTLAPHRYARVFTYPASAVDVGSAHVALVWVARRPPVTDRADAAARAALLAAGADVMALALRAAGHGIFVRPARSVDPAGLGRELGLGVDDVVVLTAVVGRDSYEELTLLLA